MAKEDIADLLLRIDATTEGLRKELKKADQTVDSFGRDVNKHLSKVDSRFDAMGASVKKAAITMGTALAGIGLAKIAGSFVDVNAEAGRLRAALVTVTGSVEEASTAWGALEEFAAKTPFALSQSVEGFIKMKALGLDPSIDALTSFGNTAAAMGKDLNQMIEAVADASTSEFERLKEFGIKAKQEGDRVKLTFQGVTTEIGNNSEEIVKYLEDIGNTQFAGAMEKQMDTLGGSMSNLGDSVDGLIRAIGDAGATSGMAAAVDFAADSIGGLTDVIDDVDLASLGITFANVEEAAKALSIVMVGRMVPAAVSSGAAFASATAQSIAYQAALARMAGVSATAAAATGAFSIAVRGASAALALIGGPLGAAVIGATALVVYWDELVAAFDKLTGAVEDSTEALQEHARYAGPYADYWDRVAGNTLQTTPLIFKSAEAIREQSVAAEEAEESLSDLGVEISGLASNGQQSFAFLKGGVDAWLDSLGDGSEDAVAKSVVAAKTLESEWDKSLTHVFERIDSAFAEAWKGAFDSFDDFASNLKEAFKQLLAELAHQAITKPIIVSIGAAFGIGGSGTAAAGGLGGIGSAISSIPSLISGGFAGLLGSLEVFDAGFLGGGLFDLGTTITDALGIEGLSGGALSGIGALGSLGAGLAGSFISNQLFGDTSGLGNTIGYAIGTAILPGVGTAIFSVLGGGLESLFGGDNDGENPGRGLIDVGAGTADVFGVGKSFGEEYVKQIQAIADYSIQLAEVIGGSAANLDIVIGRTEARVGDYITAADDVNGIIDTVVQRVVGAGTQIEEPLKQLIIGFEGTSQQTLQFAAAVVQLDKQIKQNPVTVAIEEMAKAQETASNTMWGAYQLQLEAVKTLAINFDGSAASATEMSQALTVSQQMAYQMSIALMDVSDQISVMFENSAKVIRESVMTEDERVAQWKYEREQLRAQLENISDPELLAEAAAEINDLNMKIFNSLEDVTKEQAEVFANYAEETDRIAQERIQTLLGELEASQEAQADVISDMLYGAADKQQAAGNVMVTASQNMQNAAQGFNVNFNAMVDALNSMGVNLEEIAFSVNKQASILDDVTQNGQAITTTGA